MMSLACFGNFLEVRDFWICNMPIGSICDEVDGVSLDELVVIVGFSS